VYGEGGDDKVYGGDSSNDLVDGGPGRDDIVADGICFYSGCNSGGNDQIRARDGEPDTIDCGGGYDSGDADTIDHLTGGACEALQIAAGVPAPAGSAPVGPGAPAFGLKAPARITYARLVRGGIVASIRCQAACSIDGRLLLASRSAGHSTKRLPAAGTARMTVKLNRAARRRLRRTRRASLTLRVTVTQGAATATREQRIKVQS
jgi:hypothetical protein